MDPHPHPNPVRNPASGTGLDRPRASLSRSRAPVSAPPWFLRSAGRLFLGLFLVLAVPFALFSLDVALDARKTLQDQRMALNSAVANTCADAVDAHFDGLIRYLESCALNPSLRAGIEREDAEEVRVWLSQVVKNSRYLDRAFFADADGVERYDWPPDPSVIGVSFAYRDWYRGVSRSGKGYVSEIYERAALPKQDVVAIAVPVSSSKSGTLGYVVAQYTIEKLVEHLKGILPPEASTITLFDQNGRVALPRSDGGGPPRDLGRDPLLVDLFADGGRPRVAADPITGVPSVLSAGLVDTIGWHVLAQLPSEAASAPARTFQRSLAIASLLCLAGMLGLGFTWLNVLRRHHMALLDLQRQKDLLSGMILHDLRNPLAATIGSIDLVRAHSEEMDPLLREDLSRAARSVGRARELLNTLLDIMRMEEGALALNRVRQDLASLVRSKVDEFQPFVQAASLTLSARLPPSAVEVDCDVGLIGRVLDNLITNAVKHTPRGGGIEVGLDDSKDERVILTVSDTGEGIPADARPMLFQKFAPLGGATRKGQYDTGLGLVFCRMAVERHGGTIEAESGNGRGTVFRIVLPTRPE